MHRDQKRAPAAGLMRVAAVVAFVLTLALSATSIALIAWSADQPVPTQFGLRGQNAIVALQFAVPGMIVPWRRPDHPVGWLFAVVGLVAAINAVLIEWAAVGEFLPEAMRIPTAAAWVITWIWVPLVALPLAAVPLLYPTGRLPSARWRPIARWSAVATLLAVAMAAIYPGPITGAAAIENPLGVDLGDAGGMLLAIGLSPLLASLVVALGSLAIRYRGAPLEVRQQLKWLALATAVAAAMFMAVTLATVARVDPFLLRLVEAALILSIGGISIAASLAILRYRLFEIDRVISRTVSYALVTALLAVVFVASNLGLQAALVDLTGGGTITVAAATLAVAALFQPLRRALQAPIDRRFNRAGGNAARAIAAFGARSRDEVDLDELHRLMLGTAAETVAPSAASLWLRGAQPSRRPVAEGP